MYQNVPKGCVVREHQHPFEKAVEPWRSEIVDPHERIMLLKDCPPVRFSDSEPSSSESELDYDCDAEPLEEYSE